MPIPVYDAVGGNTAASGSSLSWTHTPVGTPDEVVVGVLYFTDTTNNRTITGITYNGVAMSLVESETRDSGSQRLRLYVYHLASPAAGAQTVAVTFSGSVLVPNGISVTYTSVNTGAPLGTAVKTNTAANTVSVSPSADADDLAIAFLGYGSTGSTTHAQTPSGSGNERRDAQINNGVSAHSDFAVQDITGAGGATALGSSIATSHLALAIGVAVKPAAAATGNPGRSLALTGVG